jgi:hypothetical protein
LVDKEAEGQTAYRGRTERQLQSRHLLRLRGESRSTAAEPVAVEAKVISTPDNQFIAASRV